MSVSLKLLIVISYLVASSSIWIIILLRLSELNATYWVSECKLFFSYKDSLALLFCALLFIILSLSILILSILILLGSILKLLGSTLTLLGSTLTLLGSALILLAPILIFELTPEWTFYEEESGIFIACSGAKLGPWGP